MSTTIPTKRKLAELSTPKTTVTNSTSQPPSKRLKTSHKFDPKKELKLDDDESSSNDDIVILNNNNDNNTINNNSIDATMKDNNSLFINPKHPSQGFNFKPAMSFPFKLDDWQKEACIRLNSNDNILITAHTSAGKTVVAEYAIAKCLSNNSRVIYTSPIKALSNQKYREFCDKFNNDVGLITGDVTKNKSGGCLIMTTEILRNMLYKNLDIIREVSCIIFDEVHYMTDIERGVVWEESIILCPKYINLVFLSATISNAQDFADWITILKKPVKNKCYVIGTNKRPTPLEHYLFLEGSDTLYLMKKSSNESQILKNNFALAINNLNNNKKIISSEIKKRLKYKLSDMHRLLSLLYNKKWLPCICFNFSRREVESRALQLVNINLNTKEESNLVKEIFNNAILTLPNEDQNLDIISSILPMLKRGIGIHHSGLLPIIKEIIELLFQEGLIKILFATETFSMGINMPAKCVIFSGYEKYDGICMRILKSGEYIQMSGRAGRRGIDSKGFVILLADKNLTQENYFGMLDNTSQPLLSNFRLTYNMVLNMFRTKNDTNIKKKNTITDNNNNNNNKDNSNVNIKFLIKNSFYQFLITQKFPKIKEEIELCNEDIKLFNSQNNSNELNEFYKLYDLKNELLNDLHKLIVKPEIINPYLQAGRIVFIAENYNKSLSKFDHSSDNNNSENTIDNSINSDLEYDSQLKQLNNINENNIWGWGIVMSYNRRSLNDYFIDVLIPTVKNKYNIYPDLNYVNRIDRKDKHKLIFPKNISEYKHLNKYKDINLESVIPIKYFDNIFSLEIVRFNTNMIYKIGDVRITNIPKYLNSINKLKLYEYLFNLYKDHKEYNKNRLNTNPNKYYYGNNVLPLLHPFDDMKLSYYLEDENDNKKADRLNEQLIDIEKKIIKSKFYENLLDNNKYKTNKIKNINYINELYEYYKTKKISLLKLNILKYKEKIYNLGEFNTELNNKIKFLYKLNFISKNTNKLTNKGIFSSGIDLGDEILISELIFDGILNNLNPIEITCVLAIIMKKYSDCKLELNESQLLSQIDKKILNIYNIIKTKALNIIKYKLECGIIKDEEINKDNYLNTFGIDYVILVKQWMEGKSFKQICKLTKDFEGSIIRLLRNINDTIYRLIHSCKEIQNELLTKKLKEARKLMLRGIVFTSSLYVGDVDDDESDEEDSDSQDDENDSLSGSDSNQNIQHEINQLTM